MPAVDISAVGPVRPQLPPKRASCPITGLLLSHPSPSGDRAEAPEEGSRLDPSALCPHLASGRHSEHFGDGSSRQRTAGPGGPRTGPAAEPSAGRSCSRQPRTWENQQPRGLSPWGRGTGSGMGVLLCRHLPRAPRVLPHLPGASFSSQARRTKASSSERPPLSIHL